MIDNDVFMTTCVLGSPQILVNHVPGLCSPNLYINKALRFVTGTITKDISEILPLSGCGTNKRGWVLGVILYQPLSFSSSQESYQEIGKLDTPR